MFLCPNILFVNDAVEVTVTYSTAFPDTLSRYYVVHGQHLSLQCSYNVNFFQLSWLMGSRQIYRALDSGSGPESDVIDNMIENVIYDGKSMEMIIKVNKKEYDDHTFTCKVTTTTSIGEDSETLQPILSI